MHGNNAGQDLWIFLLVVFYDVNLSNFLGISLTLLPNV